MKIPKPILERRRSVRITESMPFRIGHQGYDIQAMLVNLSSNGVMCLVEKNIPTMTQLDIGLLLPGNTSGSVIGRKEIRIRGVVVRKDKDPSGGGFYLAIFFSKVRPNDQRTIKKFIQHRLKG